MTTDYFATERAEMQRRVTKVAADNGMAVPDAAMVLEKAYAFDAGMPAVYLASTATDAEIAAALYRLRDKAPDTFGLSSTSPLNAPGPRLDPEFRAWLRGLADDYASMPPQKKRELWSKFESEKTQAAAPSPAEVLRKQLVIRYGDVSNAPALERARLADLEGQPRPGGTPTARPDAAQAAVIRAITDPVKRLTASRAVAEYQDASRRIDQIRASAPAGASVAMARDTELRRLEQQREHLRQRFGNLFPV